MSKVQPLGSMRTSRRFRRRSRRSVADPGDQTDPLSAWMYAAGRGDQSAFAQLYDELAPNVHGIVTRVVRDPAQSEEVTQEVFVEAWRLAARFDKSRGSVRSWMATIAHRRAVDRVRSEQASRDRDRRDVDRSLLVAAPADEAVEHDLEHQRVRRALDVLTELRRQAVELAYYGGHTAREVSALLDVAEGTVKTRIRDGLIRLRDELGDTPRPTTCIISPRPTPWTRSTPTSDSSSRPTTRRVRSVGPR